MQIAYAALDRFVSMVKRRPYAVDRSIPLGSLLAVLARRAIWLGRGLLKTALLQQRIAIVFMGPGVQLRSSRRIRFGRGVTLERNLTIDGLSRSGVDIGDNVTLGAFTIIRCSGLLDLGAGVRIGRNSALDAYSFIGGAGGVTIGDDVIMGQHVSFHSENHDFSRLDVPIREQGTARQGILIEDDCWVGSNVTFLDGAHVGRGCVIAAGAVVRGEVPPYSVAAGVPARVLRSRASGPSAAATMEGAVADRH